MKLEEKFEEKFQFICTLYVRFYFVIFKFYQVNKIVKC